MINDVIYNADSIKGMALLPNESIDMILTDPPYNTGMTQQNGTLELKKGGRLKGFFNDAYSDFGYEILVKRCVEQFARLLKNDHCGYIFINFKSLNIWMNELELKGLNVKNVIVWDKIVHGLNFLNYAYTYELIIFFTKGSYQPNNKVNYAKGYWKDVWHIQREVNHSEEEGHHETVKPIKVLKILLDHGSKAGEIILDPFMGSGSTAVACKQNNRHYIGFEISENYINLAKGRLEQTTLFDNPAIAEQHKEVKKDA